MKEQKKDWRGIFSAVPKLSTESNMEWFGRLVKYYKGKETIASLKTAWDRYKTELHNLTQYNDSRIDSNKKVGSFHWRDVLTPIKQLQEINTDAKSSQDHATWNIKTDKDICIVPLGDFQLGSWGTDYNLFVQNTEELINTPNLYTIIVGDMLQMAIKLRGVLEVSDNIIPPKMQMQLLDSWLADIRHKVICAVWDNHSVIREENAVGYSKYAEIFSRHTIYHNYIGHIDIKVGSQIYKIAASHHFRGKSELNPCHAPMKYMRYQANDRDIAMQGDYHVPGIMKYWEGGKHRVAVVCGSIQTGSGYAKRYFSLTTNPDFPCISLSPHKKEICIHYSVSDWLKTQKIIK